MKRFPGKIFLISLAVVSILSGVFIFVPAQKEKPKSISEVENPHLVVKKKERLLQVYDEGELIKTYKIALGRAPRGDKETEGDGKTPEGEFYVFTKNEQSKFYLSLGLSYPNAEAAKRGLKERLISQEEYDEILRAIAEKRMPPQKTALGGEIYIHGGGSLDDWTEGCVALPNEEIKELFDAIPVGARVIIEP
jgi:murein L,D-transpeptidase YafK